MEITTIRFLKYTKEHVHYQNICISLDFRLIHALSETAEIERQNVTTTVSAVIWMCFRISRDS
jgi:hypothetical protein